MSMPPFRVAPPDKEVPEKGARMQTISALSMDQIHELIQPMDAESVDLFRRASDNQVNLRHEHVRRRLIEIYGFDGWGEQHLGHEKIHESKSREGFYTVAYTAQVRLILRFPDGSVRTFFDGAGAWGRSADDKNRINVWDLHSDALNGARSVAFCRAAKSLGPQFGLGLYSKDPENFTVGRPLNVPVPHINGAGDIAEPEQHTLGLDEETGNHERQNDPT